MICDSDFLIALMMDKEDTHARAKALYESIAAARWHILRLALYEVAGVLSRKYDQAHSQTGYRYLTGLDCEWLPIENEEASVWREFYSHARKNISFVDCANIVMARKFGLKIATFDKFYPRELVAAAHH